MSFWTNPMRRNTLPIEVRAANLAADERIRLREEIDRKNAEIERLRKIVGEEVNLLRSLLCDLRNTCCIDANVDDRKTITDSLNRLSNEGREGEK